MLPRMSAALNNSTKYSSTNRTPTQVLYGFRTREALDLLRIEDPDDGRTITPGGSHTQAPDAQPVAYPVTRNAARHAGRQVAIEVRIPPAPAPPAVPPVIPAPVPPVVTPDVPVSVDPSRPSRLPAAMDEYRPSHIDAKDAIALASIKMKEIYDSRHAPIFFKEGDLVNLRLHRGYNVPAITSKKTGQQFVGPFRVLKRVGNLAYQLELPANMRIHNVISIAHLEPATDPAEDPYHRRRLPAPALVVEGEEEYEVEKLIKKRSIRRGRGGWVTQYLVRWLTYGAESDTWESEHELLRHAKESVEDYEATNNNAALLVYLTGGSVL